MKVTHFPVMIMICCHIRQFPKRSIQQVLQRYEHNYVIRKVARLRKVSCDVTSQDSDRMVIFLVAKLKHLNSSFTLESRKTLFWYTLNSKTSSACRRSPHPLSIIRPLFSRSVKLIVLQQRQYKAGINTKNNLFMTYDLIGPLHNGFLILIKGRLL